jgi:hypothetical protein
MPKYQKEKITLRLNCSYFVLMGHIIFHVREYLAHLAGILLVCFLYSCSTVEKKQVIEMNYFPLRVGKTWIYSVEEVTTFRTNCTDNGVTSSLYEWQVKVIDSVLNKDGGFTYSIQNSKRLKPTDEWSASSTWTAQVSGNKIIVNESNVNFVKLLIPVANELVWNGNLYNNRQELNGLNVDDYKATKVSQPFTNPSALAFENTVQVIQNDEQSNILYRDSRLEVYANQVGLVYKESYLLNYFTNSQLPCYGQKKAQQGVVYKQSLKEYKQ